MKPLPKNLSNVFVALIFINIACLYGQQFTRVVDSNNAITTANFLGNYSGAAWVDIDGDGDLDLSVTRTFLFRNDGGGNFSSVNSIIGSNFINTLGNGLSWGDMDNDGDADLFMSGAPSALYRNEGNFSFTLVNDGDLSPDGGKVGWACAWADADLDGFIDLVITNPNGFTPLRSGSHFFLNDAGWRLNRISSYEFNSVLAPYTVATWSDFDLDGDPDLFIGSGPAGTAAVDYLYRNGQGSNGELLLDRLDLAPLSSDLQDGQVWNAIDYDNDRDLDIYVTNYSGAPDRFYQNDNGNYISQTTSPLVHNEASLANIWGDMDNDGDLDVIVTNDAAVTHFYRNDNGTFTTQNEPFTVSGNSRSATLGDYDDDGDLDLFIGGLGNGVGLFRNDQTLSNHWINLTLKGTVSNGSAIGAMVRAKATINGSTTWQMREVSAQNSFNSHNSQRVHFGLGDAQTVDSLIISWPGGGQSVLTNLSSDQFLTITQEIPTGFLRANFRADAVGTSSSDSLTVQFEDLSLTDPNNPILSYSWDLNGDGQEDANIANPSFTYVGADSYSVSLTVGNASGSDTKLRENYILVEGLFPDISFDETAINFGTVADTLSRIETTIWVYNGGPVADSLVVSLDVGNFDPANAVQLNEGRFMIASEDSLRLDLTIFPNQLTFSPVFYIGRINIESLFSRTNVQFSREFRLRLQQITSIDQPNTATITAFQLYENYPNPFNPSTHIRYDLPSASMVKLDIFNMLGQRVAELVNHPQEIGRYEVIWDGINSEGKKVGAGIYLFRINAVSQITGQQFVVTRKMMLLK